MGGGGVAGDGGEGGGMGGDAEVMIGVAVVDGNLRHDANYRHTPGSDLHPQSNESVIFRNIQAHRWYKVREAPIRVILPLSYIALHVSALLGVCPTTLLLRSVSISCHSCSPDSALPLLHSYA